MQVAEAIAAPHPQILKMETKKQEVMVAEQQVAVVVRTVQESDIQDFALPTQRHKHRMVVQVLSHV
jgi:hypothetical protein